MLWTRVFNFIGAVWALLLINVYSTSWLWTQLKHTDKIFRSFPIKKEIISTLKLLPPPPNKNEMLITVANKTKKRRKQICNK